jgi:hypothetical protein
MVIFHSYVSLPEGKGEHIIYEYMGFYIARPVENHADHVENHNASWQRWQLTVSPKQETGKSM